MALCGTMMNGPFLVCPFDGGSGLAATPAVIRRGGRCGCCWKPVRQEYWMCITLVFLHRQFPPPAPLGPHSGCNQTV